MTTTAWFVLQLACAAPPPEGPLAEPCAAVKVNHMGYRLAARKVAIVSWPREMSRQSPFSGVATGAAFHLRDGKGEALFTGRLSGPVDDASSGDTVFVADFSPYTKPVRRARIDVPGLGGSLPFNIAAAPYGEALRLGMRSYYLQRCGTALEARCAGRWTHEACHTQDAFYYFKGEGSGRKRCVGGWHDAGDYGKKMMTAGVTVSTIMLLCELFPDRISSLDLNIPESGDARPDILDEVKYELDWMMTMQTPDGGVHHELIPLQFQFSAPDERAPRRYLWRVSSMATGVLAASMAMASRVYRAHDAAYAERCLRSARLAWAFLRKHPGIVPPGGITKGPGTPPPLAYADTDDSDDRFWAAAELYRTTGAVEHLDYVERNGTRTVSVPSWANVYTLGVIAYLFADRPGKDAAFQSRVKEQFLCMADAAARRIERHPYRIPLQTFGWGSNAAVMRTSMMLLLAHRLATGDRRRLAAAEEGLHYVLGRNAVGLCFLSHASARSVRNIHHLWGRFSGIDGSPPGLLSGGPNQRLQDAVTRRAVGPSTPPAKCFADRYGAYSSNENDICYNAPFVFTAGYLHFAGQE